jgi:hypothetical protein
MRAAESSTKYCRRCDSHKELAAFARSRRNRDGLQDWCRSCSRAYATSRRGSPATPRATGLQATLHCQQCKQYKPRECFAPASRHAKHERRGNCLECGRKRLAALAQKERAGKRVLLDRTRRSNACQICGEYEPVVLDFHHLDPATKVYQIMQKATSVRTLRAELMKCAVLCANCHRRLHAGHFPGIRLTPLRLPD